MTGASTSGSSTTATSTDPTTGSAADDARRSPRTWTPPTWTPSHIPSTRAIAMPLGALPAMSARARRTSPSTRRGHVPSAACRDLPAAGARAVTAGVTSEATCGMTAGATSGVAAGVTAGPRAVLPMRRRVYLARSAPARLRARSARHRATPWPPPAAHGSDPRMCPRLTAGRGHRQARDRARRGRAPGRAARPGSAPGSRPSSRPANPWTTPASRRVPRLPGPARPGLSRAATGPASRRGRASQVHGRTPPARTRAARAARAARGNQDRVRLALAGRTEPEVTSAATSAVTSESPGARPAAVPRERPGPHPPQGHPGTRRTDRGRGTGRARHRLVAGQPRIRRPSQPASAARA
jgi:hypothetical protein